MRFARVPGPHSLSILIAALVALGCSADPPGGDACASADDCPAGQACVDGACTERVDPPGDADASTPPPNEVLSVRVEPPAVTLDAVDGATPTQAFTLIGTRRDGTEVPLDGVSWSLDDLRLGEVDGSGTFTANGHAGGEVTLTGSVASPASLSATATITVTVRSSVFGPGVETDAPDRFSGTPETDPTAIDVLYPLEGAVMPANVFPPTVQWAPVGAAGDLYRVRVQKPHAELTGYLIDDGATFGHGWAVPRDAWRPIADSDPDAEIAITVDRYEAATGRLIGAAGPRTMRLARGNVFGTVYYEHRAGSANILEIDPETATNADLIANPYPTSGGQRCVGCHAMTHDGRYAFATNAETWATYDLTVDLSGDPPASLFAPAAGSTTVGSFDPTGDYLVGGNHSSGPVAIFERATGAMVPSTGLPTSAAGYPSWSPDGMHIVYSGDIVGDSSGPVSGNLYIADRAAGTMDFTPRLAHSGDSLASMPEGGTNDAHPTWSPDSRFVAFQHGQGTWTHVVRHPGALYLLAEDGTVHRLDHANGPTGTDGYWPTFAPYVTEEAGGRRYYWMAFYTRRDYGNATLGTQGTGLRQLWVTAIDSEPTAGSDPSMVPYWLPGQGLRTSNFSAFWAPEACRATGAACDSASVCCSGRCEPDDTGAYVCTPPPEEECHHTGESCGGDADCCAGLSCEANVCAEVPI